MKDPGYYHVNTWAPNLAVITDMAVECGAQVEVIQPDDDGGYDVVIFEWPSGRWIQLTVSTLQAQYEQGMRDAPKAKDSGGALD